MWSFRRTPAQEDGEPVALLRGELRRSVNGAGDVIRKARGLEVTARLDDEGIVGAVPVLNEAADGGAMMGPGSHKALREQGTSAPCWERLMRRTCEAALYARPASLR